MNCLLKKQFSIIKLLDSKIHSKHKIVLVRENRVKIVFNLIYFRPFKRQKTISTCYQIQNYYTLISSKPRWQHIFFFKTCYCFFPAPELNSSSISPFAQLFDFLLQTLIITNLISAMASNIQKHEQDI